MPGELKTYIPDPDPHETRHTLFLLGGAAIVVFGAGLMLSTPVVRRQLKNGLGTLLSGGFGKDLARYMRMRAM